MSCSGVSETGAGGEVRVEVWHHPEHGYAASGRDEAGRETHSNPETDAVVAVDVAHLHEFTSEP